MHRTQIYFPKELHKDLNIQARVAGMSVSEYIRKTLEERLYKKPLIKGKGRKGGLLVIAKNAVNLGKKDLARNFDKYFEESLK